jgi:hypothetical protein
MRKKRGVRNEQSPIGCRERSQKRKKKRGRGKTRYKELDT